MINCYLSGGIGNNMFQYAFAKSLSLRMNLGINLYMDFYKNYKKTNYKSELVNLIDADIFKIRKKYFFFNIKDRCENYLITKKLYSSKNKFFEKNIGYNPIDTNVKYKNISLYGYWQSYKYFQQYDEIIKSAFNFKNVICDNFKKNLKKVQNTNSTAIFIRRSDYINNINTNNIHGACDLTYYNDCINYLNSIKKNNLFYIFSDDINWCKTKYSSKEYIYLDTHKSEKHLEIMLMANCKNLISSNSSFSWWAGWLNNNKEKTILVPYPWYKKKSYSVYYNDLIPKNWKSIKTNLV